MAVENIDGVISGFMIAIIQSETVYIPSLMTDIRTCAVIYSVIDETISESYSHFPHYRTSNTVKFETAVTPSILLRFNDYLVRCDPPVMLHPVRV